MYPEKTRGNFPAPPLRLCGPVTADRTTIRYVAVDVALPTVVRTPLGALRGAIEGGVSVWRGVPYAQQPVEQLRFLAPVPLEPWEGVRDAIEHAPLPPQGKSFVGAGRDDPKIRGEECLTVTVWSPDVHASLPVMVWIPGGAFVFGAGQLELYSGARLAANGNVVVVNVTYRLGALGGLELSALGEGFDDNLALRDQMAALTWVRDNIAAFGGNPDHVTIFGESAGATSVLALLASPAAKGLFGRAIAQSPALPLIADKALRDKRAHRYLELLDVTDPSRLKVLPQRELRRGAAKLQIESATETPVLGYGLAHGTELLPYHPIEAARRGEVHQVPLIIGSNSHEASMFARVKPPMLPTTEPTVNGYFNRIGPEYQDAIIAAYPGYPSRQALVAVGSDAMFAAPMWAFADAYSAFVDTYMYRFDHTAWGLKLLGLGATHGSEIVHVQHSYGSFVGMLLSPLGARMMPSVGRRMQRAWLDFATGAGPEDWPTYGADGRRTRIIRSRSDVIVEDPDSVRRIAWAQVH